MLIDSEHRIITTDGYQTDENNALDELIIPSHVKTLAAPSKVTFEGTVLNWAPSTTAALQELVTDATAISDSLFNGYTALLSVTLNKMTVLTTRDGGQFTGCTNLNSITAPLLQEINTASTWAGSIGAFKNCVSLVTVNLPKIRQLRSSGSSVSTNGAFRACTGLLSVTLGSEGNPVNEITSAQFASCTQSGLTITIYTNGGTSLANEPWGATNASIVYAEA